MAGWRFGNFASGATYLQLRKTCILQQNCSKTCILASWRPRRPADEPPGVQDSLRTALLTPKTAYRRAFWRSRWPLDGPLSAKTACRRVSWRSRWPLDGPLSAQDRKTAVTTAFCAAKPAVCLACYDDCLDETSVGST